MTKNDWNIKHRRGLGLGLGLTFHILICRLPGRLSYPKAVSI